MNRAGYTLVEVLIAAAILMIAIAAAASMAVATVAQEEINSRVARCVNLHEQAARLWQLGLDQSAISAILPPDPAVVSYPDFGNSSSLAIPGLGTVEQAETTLTFSTSDDSGATRTSPPAPDHPFIITIRPSLR